MKRKFLKLVITLSLSVCFGLGSLVGGVGRQALATSVTESVAAESEVMVEDLDSTSKEFYDFLTKYSDFDSSKLNGEDKKLYDNITKNFATYVTDNELGLSAEEQKVAVNLLWGLGEEDVSDEAFDEILAYVGMDMSGFVKVVIFSFQEELTDVEVEFYNLIIKSHELDVTKLTEDQKKIFDTLKSNASKFVAKYELELEEDEIFEIASILYNMMDSSTKLSTKLLTEVVYYLGIDFSLFEELSGEFFEKFKDYVPSTSVIFDYVNIAYAIALDHDMSAEDIDNIAVKLSEGNLTAKEFVLGILDQDGFYSDNNVSDLVNKLYNVILLRNVDEDGLKLWNSKLDELVKGGKSTKDAVKYVANEMMGSDEFKAIVEDFGLKY